MKYLELSLGFLLGVSLVGCGDEPTIQEACANVWEVCDGASTSDTTESDFIGECSDGSPPQSEITCVAEASTCEAAQACMNVEE